MKSSSIKRVALLLLAWYLPTVLTLDLHHNHSSHMPAPRGSGFAVITAGQVSGQDREAGAPCPVLLVMLGHGPVPVSGIDLSGICCDYEGPAPSNPESILPSPRNARSPPVF